MELEKMQKLYDKFVKNLQSGHHRYSSYDVCKNYFDDHYGKDLTAEEKDEFCLRLFAFLASWGMLRGNDWLIWKSYKFFGELADLLFNTEYNNIKDIDPLDENFNVDTYCDNVVKLQQNIYETLKDSLAKDEESDKENDKESDKENRDNKISPLMVNKIIMVTYGCLIPYDRFNNKALKHLHKFEYGDCRFTVDGSNENRKSLLKKTYEFIKENRDNFIIIKNKNITNYPVFKIVDMILWEYGKELENS